jgi:hypothetical protein
MKTAHLVSIVCLFLGIAIQPAFAVNVDLLTTPMTIEPRSLSFSFDGINASVSGYHVEYDASSSSSDKTTVYGPFSTAEIAQNIPIFGMYYQYGGLGLLSDENLGQTADDTGQAASYGFDNADAGGCFNNNTPSCALPSFQFALFNFDTPVSLSQIVMDYGNSASTDIWVAGGNTAPDFSGGFLGAFSGYSVINSSGTLTSPTITHTFSPLQNVTYIAIGVSPYTNIGDLGPVKSTANRSDFFIQQLSLTEVPIPAALWLFGSGLLGLIGFSRRKKAA